MVDGTAPAPRVLRAFAHRLSGDQDALPVEGPLASFEGAVGWLNSGPLTPDGLRGRVVLVDFWTYTCVNWLRTAPYVRAWDAKYRDMGLTLIGVHTPEFTFERDIDNVTKSLAWFDVRYPVAVDSSYGVWRAFQNHYWPAVYISDAEGRIRYHHFGEGEYAMTEMVVQQLLREAGAEVDMELASVEPRGLEVPADWQTLRSPETYLGFDQTTGFAAESIARLDVAQTYPSPRTLGLNEWAPVGPWTVARHASISAGPGARIAFRFHARDVNLVMGPAAPDAPLPFRVLLDGVVPGNAHGADAAADGTGTLLEQRTYQLIRQPADVRERTFEIEFDGAGAEAYCFTFG